MGDDAQSWSVQSRRRQLEWRIQWTTLGLAFWALCAALALLFEGAVVIGGHWRFLVGVPLEAAALVVDGFGWRHRAADVRLFRSGQDVPWIPYWRRDWNMYTFAVAVLVVAGFAAPLLIPASTAEGSPSEPVFHGRGIVLRAPAGWTRYDAPDGIPANLTFTAGDDPNQAFAANSVDLTIQRGQPAYTRQSVRRDIATDNDAAQRFGSGGQSSRRYAGTTRVDGLTGYVVVGTTYYGKKMEEVFVWHDHNRYDVEFDSDHSAVPLAKSILARTRFD